MWITGGIEGPFAGPRGNFMYYWYASLYVVVGGFQKLHLNDPTIEALVLSPNAHALRRCRNAVLHLEAPAEFADDKNLIKTSKKSKNPRVRLDLG